MSDNKEELKVKVIWSSETKVDPSAFAKHIQSKVQKLIDTHAEQRRSS